MGENSAATVREIEQTRERLEEELTELQDRLPQPAGLAKRAGAIAAAGGAAATVLVVLRRRRKKRREAEEAARLARLAPVGAVVQLLPDDWTDRIRGGLEDGKWKPWVAGAAGLYVAFRLAEIRQLRKMNKTLLANGS